MGRLLAKLRGAVAAAVTQVILWVLGGTGV